MGNREGGDREIFGFKEDAALDLAKLDGHRRLIAAQYHTIE